jgi:choline-glycine betaine transporter
MNRSLQIASGISILFTTLGFSHILFHNTLHMLSSHEDGQSFVVLHAVVAIVLVVFSLAGAFCLLKGPRKQRVGPV